jgi:hypothetical protein
MYVPVVAKNGPGPAVNRQDWTEQNRNAPI